MRINKYIYFAFCIIFLIGCTSDTSVEPEVELETVFGNFEVLEDNSVFLSGTITESSAANITSLLKSYPNTTTINMGDVNGATSHEAAFEAARIVRSNNLDIHVVDNSTVRKEATNFMLGGINRTKGENVRIGVSAWVNDQGMEATEFGFGDPAHLPWINFYQEMQFTFTLASDFYFFSINGAPSNDILFMTEDQLNTFDIIN